MKPVHSKAEQGALHRAAELCKAWNSKVDWILSTLVLIGLGIMMGQAQHDFTKLSYFVGMASTAITLILGLHIFSTGQHKWWIVVSVALAMAGQVLFLFSTVPTEVVDMFRHGGLTAVMFVLYHFSRSD